MTFEEWWATYAKVPTDETSTEDYVSYLDKKSAALHAWEASRKDSEQEVTNYANYAQASQRAVDLLKLQKNQYLAGITDVTFDDKKSQVVLTYIYDSTALHAYTVLRGAFYDYKIEKKVEQDRKTAKAAVSTL